jgi:hypothetical protein
MLSNLSEQVRDCLRHAEERAYRAKIEPDAALTRDYIEMERRWLALARSCQFSEQLEEFSAHNKKRQDEAAEYLKKLPRK